MLMELVEKKNKPTKTKVQFTKKGMEKMIRDIIRIIAVFMIVVGVSGFLTMMLNFEDFLYMFYTGGFRKPSKKFKKRKRRR